MVSTRVTMGYYFREKQKDAQTKIKLEGHFLLHISNKGEYGFKTFWIMV